VAKAGTPNIMLDLGAPDLGQMSLVQLIEFPRVIGVLAYVRAPEEIARDQLGAGSPGPEGGTAR